MDRGPRKFLPGYCAIDHCGASARQTAGRGTGGEACEKTSLCLSSAKDGPPFLPVLESGEGREIVLLAVD